MNDYTVKRRYRLPKLSKEGCYKQRHARSRERRRLQVCSGTIPSLQQIAQPENLLRVCKDLKAHAGNAPGPDRISHSQVSRFEVAQIMRDLSREILSEQGAHGSRSVAVSG
jgi:hypothetical protein